MKQNKISLSNNKINTVFKITAIFILLTISTSCATGSSIITGQAKPAIDPSLVKIYLTPPEEHEVIGLVEASSEIELSRQWAQDRVINELKERAARIGANGVILQGTGSKSSGTTGYYSNGIYFASTSEKITGQGKAIFVKK